MAAVTIYSDVNVGDWFTCGGRLYIKICGDDGFAAVQLTGDESGFVANIDDDDLIDDIVSRNRQM